MKKRIAVLCLLIALMKVSALVFDATSMSSYQGFKVLGDSGNLGFRATPIGDFNNDGISDLLFTKQNSPQAFVVYGGSSATTSGTFTVSASMLSTQGFRINGPSSSSFGSAVASGDFNGDGYSDIFIGATGANTAYVLFGDASSAAVATKFTSSFTVSASMTTAQGFQLNGSSGSNFGYSMAAGDFNGDGRADVIIGAPLASKVYIIFGCATGLLATRFTSSFTVTSSMYYYQGIEFVGTHYNNFGYDVSCGDLDSDYLSEIIIGAVAADIIVIKGTSYTDLGSSNPFGTSFTPNTAMTIAQGFEVGAPTSSYFGTTVAAIGDFNGDGYGDFVIGSPSIAVSTAANRAWILFGTANLRTRFGASFTLSSTMTTGVAFELQMTALTGFDNKVSMVGDINKDGYADFSINVNNVAYVILGCTSSLLSSRFGSSVAVSSNMNALQGFQVTGPTSSNFYGKMTRAGDINNDGYQDLIFGAYSLNQAYIVLGYCSAGTYQSGGSCVACPAGSYCQGGVSKSTCPSSTNSAASSTSSTACSCIAGTYSTSTGGACQACPSNYYCEGGSNLRSCPIGSASAAGATKSSDCTATTAGGNGNSIVVNITNSGTAETASSGSPTGAIIGAVVGIIVILLGGGLTTHFILKKRARQGKPSLCYGNKYTVKKSADHVPVEDNSPDQTPNKNQV